MTTPDETTGYQPSRASLIAPGRQSGSWNLARDYAYCGAALALWGYLFVYGVIQMLGTLLYIVSFGLTLITMRFGRLYRQPAIKLRSWYYLHVLRGIVWQRDKLPRTLQQPIQTEAHSIALNPQGDRLGLLSGRLNIDGVAFNIDGWDSRCMDEETQLDDVTNLARQYKELSASIKGYQMGVSMIYRVRPQNYLALLEQELADMHPAVMAWFTRLAQDELVDERLLKGDDLTNKRIAEDKWQRMYDDVADTREVTGTIVLSCDRDNLLRKLAKKRAEWTQRDVHGLTISRLAKSAHDRFEAIGMSGVHALDLQETIDHLRATHDTAGLSAYRNQRAEARLKAIESGQPEDPRKNTGQAYPQERIVIRPHAETGQLQALFDDTPHALLQITATERLISALEFVPLYLLPATYFTVAMIGSTIRSDRQVALGDIHKSLTGWIRDWRQIDEPTHRMSRSDQERKANADALDASRWTLNHIILVDISGLKGDTDVVEDEARECISYLEANNFRVARVNEASQLIPGIMSCAGLNQF